MNMYFTHMNRLCNLYKQVRQPIWTCILLVWICYIPIQIAYIIYINMFINGMNKYFIYMDRLYNMYIWVFYSCLHIVTFFWFFIILFFLCFWSSWMLVTLLQFIIDSICILMIFWSKEFNISIIWICITIIIIIK